MVVDMPYKTYDTTTSALKNAKKVLKKQSVMQLN